MKRRYITLLLSIVLFISQLQLTFASIPSDTKTHWANTSIEKWINQGYIDGYSDGSFKPNNEITRAEFVKLINKAFKPQNSSRTLNFRDVKSSDWFYDDVLLGAAAGYISGYPDGSFKPNDSISRQEVALIIKNVLKLDESQENSLNQFKDSKEIPNWSKNAINSIVKLGIMQGYDNLTFKAERNITRAEAVVTLERALTDKDNNLKEQGITGVVTYEGKPVEGATVKLFAQDGYKVIKSVTTDINGVYRISISKGIYDLTVEKESLVGFKSDSTVKSDNPSTQDLTLTKGVKVSGKIIDSTEINYSKRDITFTTNPTFVTTTNDDGTFSLYVLPERAYTIRYLDTANGIDTFKEIASNVSVGSTDKDMGSLNVSNVNQSVSSNSNSSSGYSDTTPPSILLTSPSVVSATYDTFYPTITIMGTAADNEMVTSIEYSIRNLQGKATGRTTWSISDLPLEIGQNEVIITAVDLSNNKSSTKITINRVQDTIAPVIEISSPTNELSYVTENNSISIAGTASDNHRVSTITYSDQDGNTGVASGTGNWVTPNLALKPGNNRFTITATDVTGNKTDKNLTVFYKDDQTAPSISITVPTTDSTYITSSSTITISGTATDNKVVSSVSYTVYGITKSAVGTNSWSVPNLNLLLGENKVIIKASDANGNEASALVTIIYDTDAPAIAITSPSSEPNLTVYNSLITLSGTARDNQSVTSVTYSVYSGSVASATYGVAVGTTNWNIPNLQLKPGSNTLTVIATDSAKNTASTAVNIFNAVDTDNDGLPDYMEEVFGTDSKKVDTDGDGLSDGYEFVILNTNPLKKDTDDNGTPDDQEDFDGDGLTNLQEMGHKTNPNSSDTDGDGLIDFQELYIYHTDPLKQDTDGDGLDDGSEIKLGFDPLKVDTDGNGIIDSEEKIPQKVDESKFSGINPLNSLTVPSLTINGSGDINKSIIVNDASNAPLIKDNTAVVGNVIDIKLPNTFDTAQVSFILKSDALSTNNLDDLAIAWFKEDGTVVPLKTTLDKSTNQLSTTVTHFSKYGVINLVQLALNWELTTESSTVEKGQADIVFVLDTTGSMGTTIDNVKSNILSFVDKLDGNKVSVRLGLVDYKDITSDGLGSTKSIGWYNDPTQFKNMVNSIYVYGGGDIPESAVDGLEEARRMDFRKNVTKFMVLITDADYKEETRFEEVKTMNDEIGLLKKDGIITSVISRSYEKAQYENLFTQTDGIWADIYNNFSVNLDQLKDKISSKTNDGVWVRLNTGKVVKLIKEPDKMDMVTDTDGDTVPDSSEISELITIDLPNWVRELLSSRFPGKTFPEKVDVWTYKSDPTNTDSDSDGKSDLIDERPLIAYKPAVVLIHGINSSSGSAWGAETNVWNYYDKYGTKTGALWDIENHDGKFSQDTSNNFDTRVTYKKGSRIAYSNIDSQRIREPLRNNKLASYLKSSGNYVENKNLFVFQWEANDHLTFAAGDVGLKGYLNNLADYIKDKTKDVDIFKDGRVQFDLVGHSAGGLVSRFYIENLMDQNNLNPHIEKLITVDSPHWGSNYLHNPGLCKNVLGDLDRDDSYLFYSNVKNKSCLTKLQSLDSTEDEIPADSRALSGNHPTTNYYFIGGIKLRTKDSNNSLMIRTDSFASNDNDLFNDADKKRKQFLGDIKFQETDVTDEDFGDAIVSLGSEMGVPSDEQLGVDGENGHIRYIGATDRFYFMGPETMVYHTAIEQQEIVFKLITMWISNQEPPNIISN